MDLPQGISPKFAIPYQISLFLKLVVIGTSIFNVANAEYINVNITNKIILILLQTVIMLKQQSTGQNSYFDNLPFLLNNKHKLDIVQIPERPALQQLLAPDESLNMKHLNYDQQQQQITFEQKSNKRSQQKRVSFQEYQALQQENEQLKNQIKKLSELALKHEQLIKNYMEIQEELNLRQSQLYEKQSTINNLTSNIRSIEKRRSTLQFQISKLNKQLLEEKQDIQKYQKQISHLLMLNKNKDNQIIQLMSKHSKQEKRLEQQHFETKEQYEKKNQQTKKLIQKLNMINNQKQSKMMEEINEQKIINEKLQKLISTQNNKIENYQQQIQKLKQSNQNTINQLEKSILTLKIDHEKIINDIKINKQVQINKMTNEYKNQLEKKEKQIGKLLNTLTLRETQLKNLHQDREKIRQNLEDKIQYLKQEQQKKLLKKDSQIDYSKEIIDQKKQQIETINLQNQELLSKISTLQKNQRDIYQQCTSLQNKLFQANKEKSQAQYENTQIKNQMKLLKQVLTHFQNKSKNFNQQQNQYMYEIKQSKLKYQKIQQQNRLNEKRLKQLQIQLTRVKENQVKITKEHGIIKQNLIQKQIDFQQKNHQCQKLKKFLENYKYQSQRNRQSTQRKWKQLKIMYDAQIHELEQRIKASQKRENSLYIKYENMERQCKQYEYELTMSSEIKQFEPYR